MVDQVKKKPPLGVLLISLLYFYLCLLGVIVLMVGLAHISNYIHNIQFAVQQDVHKFIRSAIFDIWKIALMVIYFLIGRNLWVGKKWAKILVIIFNVFGIVESIYALLVSSGIAFFANMKAVVCILIILYLLLNKNAIKHFQNNRQSNLSVVKNIEVKS